MKKYSLEIVVFICGAVVMILEMVGSRVLAPHVGTSIVVWTSLIGIILGSLSIGYYYGGRLADKNATPYQLGRIIFLAAVLIAATALFKKPTLIILSDVFSNIYYTTIIATVTLFAPASIALGMISPYAAKLKMQDTAHAGATIGTLYALSTTGSIVGTFLAGFFLVAFFGSTNILYFLSGLLTFTTLLLYREKLKTRFSFLALFLALALLSIYTDNVAKSAGIIDVDTNYQRVTITPITYHNRSVRLLMTDVFGAQSGMYLDGSTSDLVFEYSQMYNLVKHFHQPKKSLLIGGGAYSYPKAFIKQFPEAEIDVIELDAKLTKLARQYFGLIDNPRLHIFHEDGRMFINRMSTNTYDSIFIDAFNSMTIPYQLTTEEAVQKIYSGLTDEGVVIMNIIGAFEGDASDFFRAEYATYKKVFPQVHAFWVAANDADQLQNIILVASKSPKPWAATSTDSETASYLAKLWKDNIDTQIPVLTDEFAPVDRYTMGLYQ